MLATDVSAGMRPPGSLEPDSPVTPVLNAAEIDQVEARWLELGETLEGG